MHRPGDRNRSSFMDEHLDQGRVEEHWQGNRTVCSKESSLFKNNPKTNRCGKQLGLSLG